MPKHYDEIIEAFEPERTAGMLFQVDRRKLRLFLAGYLEAIAFTDAAEESDELHGLDLTIEGEGGWGDGELKRMLEDANEFMPRAYRVISRRCGLGDLWADGVGYTVERSAHDLWLTRNGHGAGFWDRRFTYGEDGDEIPELGDELTAIVTDHFPQLDAYKGDDGKAYLS